MTIHGSQHSDDREKHTRFPSEFPCDEAYAPSDISEHRARGVFVIHFAMLNVHSDTLAKGKPPGPRVVRSAHFLPKNHFMISIKPTIKR